MCSYLCTIMWARLMIFPVFFTCSDCWKNTVYPAWTIPLSTYHSLGRLFRNPNLNNICLTVVDNAFNKEKAQILYNLLSENHHLRGFTFVNNCGFYNFEGREWDDFEANMQPIKQLNSVISDIRWGRKTVSP